MNLRLLRLVLSDLLVFSGLILPGCASHPEGEQQQVTQFEEDFNDPLENTNRKIFEFNQFVDRNAIVPAATHLMHLERGREGLFKATTDWLKKGKS